MSAAALAKLGTEALKFAIQNPAIVANAVELAQALTQGKSGAKEYVKLRRSADAEAARRKAIAGAAKRK